MEALLTPVQLEARCSMEQRAKIRFYAQSAEIDHRASTTGSTLAKGRFLQSACVTFSRILSARLGLIANLGTSSKSSPSYSLKSTFHPSILSN